MGIKYGRTYAAIISEFAQALGDIEEIGAFLGMAPEDWDALQADTQIECIRTVADDLFYALGTEKEMSLGTAMVLYDELHHRICVRYAGGAETGIDLTE